MILEAQCTKCGDTFSPHSDNPEDLEHYEDADGNICGGQGVLLGSWSQEPSSDK